MKPIKADFSEYMAALFICMALSGCAEEDQRVTLAGRVTYDDYQSGVIVIQICESESSSYDGAAVVVQTPGDCIEKIVLDAPGGFSVDTTISWAETAPEIQIMAYLVPSAETNLRECAAGAFSSVSVADHRDIALDLVALDCPMRD